MRWSIYAYRRPPVQPAPVDLSFNPVHEDAWTALTSPGAIKMVNDGWEIAHGKDSSEGDTLW